MANVILEYMSQLLSARALNDEDMLRDLRNTGKNVCVKLEDVGVALDTLTEDLIDMIDSAQELQEIRMVTIVEALDEVTKARIKSKFKEAEDDLLDHDENMH